MQDEFRINYCNIGKNIRCFRLWKRMTQEELAERAAVSIGFISKIERADLTNGFSCTTVLKIAKALQIPPCVLFNEGACLEYIKCLGDAKKLNDAKDVLAPNL